MKYKKTFLLIISIFFSLYLNLIWLFLLIVSLILFYKKTKHLITISKNRFFKYVFNTVASTILILLIFASIKLLILGIYKIPSSSMENTLFANDVIMVNKIKYGPRLPRSPLDIPFINIFYHFNDDTRKQNKEYCWPYKRLSGTTSVKQGDVMVFNSTWNKNYIIVKRCVGLPSDTLNIKDTEIYTNNNLFREPSSVKNNYKFKVKNKNSLYRALDSFSNNVILKNKYNKFNEASLTTFQLKHLIKQKDIDSITIQIDTFAQRKLFSKLPLNLKWTFDNMGPLVVPKKGMKIALNPENFLLYNRIFNSSVYSKIKEVKGVYYINDKKVTHYTFKQNYYFMMGDNRKGTMDSRRWGFVPEQNIIGKVECVLFSNYQDEFQWGRLLKSVN